MRDLMHADAEDLTVLIRLRADDAAHLTDLLGKADLFQIQLDLIRFDLAHVENVVDEAQQVTAGEFDLLDVAAQTVGGVALVLHQIRDADDGVHRRSDIVRHIGEELALGPARGLGMAGRCFGALHRLGKLGVLAVELAVDLLERLGIAALDGDDLLLLDAQHDVDEDGAHAHHDERKDENEPHRRMDERDRIARNAGGRD